jgi:hypothetical protein
MRVRNMRRNGKNLTRVRLEAILGALNVVLSAHKTVPGNIPEKTYEEAWEWATMELDRRKRKVYLLADGNKDIVPSGDLARSVSAR